MQATKKPKKSIKRKERKATQQLRDLGQVLESIPEDRTVAGWGSKPRLGDRTQSHHPNFFIYAMKTVTKPIAQD